MPSGSKSSQSPAGSGPASAALEWVLVDGVRELPPAAWDQLVDANDPFLTHAFLHTVERSGSVGADAGCRPRFVVAYRGNELVGAVPLYEKAHSYGEFIFDWSWANAAARARLPYYPKLVAFAPYTPATGRRLLVRPDQNFDEVAATLMRGVHATAEQIGASSVHFLFCTEAETRWLAEHHAYAARLSMQFHWHNRSEPPYANFEDFLTAFRSENRKQVRKERRVAASHGLRLSTVGGRDLSERDWSALRHFYDANAEKHNAIAYLRPAFFSLARETLADLLVVTLAHRGDEPVAGSINFERGRHLYGRYWGCLEEHAMLHFELCYYQLIERAITRGYTRFEAGAQGEHKLKRGLLPSSTHSAHWLAHPALAHAVQDFVQREAVAVEEEIKAYGEHSPFQRG